MIYLTDLHPPASWGEASSPLTGIASACSSSSGEEEELVLLTFSSIYVSNSLKPFF